LNLFGYTMKKKPSLILMHMLNTTHNGWAKRMQDNGHMENYRFHLYRPEE